jgi:hypothetical protein
VTLSTYRLVHGEPSRGGDDGIPTEDAGRTVPHLLGRPPISV